LRRYSLDKKLQSETATREKLSKTILHQKGVRKMLDEIGTWRARLDRKLEVSVNIIIYFSNSLAYIFGVLNIIKHSKVSFYISMYLALVCDEVIYG